MPAMAMKMNAALRSQRRLRGAGFSTGEVSVFFCFSVFFSEAGCVPMNAAYDIHSWVLYIHMLTFSLSVTPASRAFNASLDCTSLITFVPSLNKYFSIAGNYGLVV